MRDFQEYDAPTFQQLSAYLDGELDAPTRARVEAWLARHPEVAAELEADRCLERAWATDPLPEPSEAEWSAVRRRIHAAMPTPGRVSAAPRARWAGVASAAAVLLALFLYRPTARNDGVPTLSHEPPETPFAVVTDNDVEILSMDAADADALVVGEMPMRGPVVLAGPGDVVLDVLLPEDGMEAPMQMGMGPTTDNGNGPMIVVPVTLVRADR